MSADQRNSRRYVDLLKPRYTEGAELYTGLADRFTEREKLSTFYQSLSEIDLDVLIRCEDICLSLEPDDMSYFKVEKYVDEFTRIYESYKRRVMEEEGQPEIIADIAATVKALSELHRRYGMRYVNLPYSLRIIACICSRLLKQRISEKLVVQPWTGITPEIVNKIVSVIEYFCRDVPYEQRRLCVEEMYAKLMAKYPWIFNPLMYLYAILLVAEAFIKALTELIEERHRVALHLDLDLYKYWQCVSALHDVSGTSPPASPMFGGLYTVHDVVMSKYRQLLTVEIPYPPAFLDCLYRFLDYLEKACEITCRELPRHLPGDVPPEIRNVVVNKLLSLANFVPQIGQALRNMVHGTFLVAHSHAMIVNALRDLHRTVYDLRKELEVNVIYTILYDALARIKQEMEEQKRQQVQVGKIREVAP